MSPRSLFLVRHGRAVEDAPGGDAARALTAEGRGEVACVGRALQAFGVRPDAIWHSPYARALETAILLGEALGVRKLVPESALVPSSSAERALRLLLEAASPTLLVVSHMPLLPALAHEFLGARVDFGPATVAHVAIFPGGALLSGLWTATQLSLVRLPSSGRSR